MKQTSVYGILLQVVAATCIITDTSVVAFAWQPPIVGVKYNTVLSSPSSIVHYNSRPSSTALHIFQEKTKTESNTDDGKDNITATTEKYGLEAGLFESLKQKDGGATAKGLLKKYGIAYLATSIPLAIVSFAVCYYLVDAGVDVSSLLAKVGIVGNIEQKESMEKAGTVAIAYAAHKAASPIRFPPTVLLTPVVAKWIGKEPELLEEE